MSDRIRFIPSPANGANVLLMDLSGFVNTADSFRYIREARETVAAQPPLSLHCLVDVSGSRFNVDVVEAMKDLAMHNKPFVIATALVGVTGLQRVILESVVKLTGRKNLKQMPSRAEAFDWLAAQKPAS
jgi:hypothetical protein